MTTSITNISELNQLGLSSSQIERINHYLSTLPASETWKKIITEVLTSDHSFELHKVLYTTVYPDWEKLPAPAWFPSIENLTTSNIATRMAELIIKSYEHFHAWSVENYPEYWRDIITKLNIRFEQPFSKIVDLAAGIESPKWLPDAKLNIVNSCFNAPKDAIAIIYQAENGALKKTTYEKLDKLSNQVASGLLKYFKSGDAIGICMPMTAECIAIYLGIIKAGCVVVSIADSFSADEISTRLKITQAKGIFTQDFIFRSEKYLPLYVRVKDASAPTAIVLACEHSLTEKLRPGDKQWHEFLAQEDSFLARSANPQDWINILFSSGTTGTPKAIPWNHTTAIKVATDAYFHQDIQPGDVLAWPTNIGWMMGPWLIFASLLNQGTLALFDGVPSGKSFGKFVQDAKVTMLGVVPSFVKIWRSSACMEGLDWSAIKCFSSTGESSNVEDMLYLMSLVNYKPIIEYCGGTEIGGAYLTSTLVQPNAPAAFSTPTLGLDLILLDEEGKTTNIGEVALIPPSMGLSTELLTPDHHQIYFEGMPKSSTQQMLRRHGDQLEKFPNGFYRALGRVDDTMNLGGIKISSAEIERTLVDVENVLETAAIAITPPAGGPSLLVIYAVPKDKSANPPGNLKTLMQTRINQHLNPLFKIHDVVLIDALPRTASNKVMRRVLRKEWGES